MPLFAAFFRRERGVQQSHLRSESVMQLRGHSRSQANLGNQKNRRAAGVERAPHRSQIDGGFSGSSNAVQQKGAKSWRVHRAGDRSQRFKLRMIQLMVGRGESPRVGEMKVGGTLLDAHQLFAHEGRQGRRWHFEPPQFGHRQLAIGPGELGENRLLIVVELRQPHAIDEHRVAHGPRGIARLSLRLARNPLFADHPGEQAQRRAGHGSKTRGPHRLARLERVEDRIFLVLFFRRQPRTARRALLRSRKERLPSHLGDAIENEPPHFTHQGQHRAEDFADRRQVVLRNPLAQLHQFARQNRFAVENREQRLSFDRRGIVVDANHHARQFFVAKGNEDPRADGRIRFACQISKDAVERDGQGDIAESGHQVFFGA